MAKTLVYRSVWLLIFSIAWTSSVSAKSKAAFSPSTAPYAPFTPTAFEHFGIPPCDFLAESAKLPPVVDLIEPETLLIANPASVSPFEVYLVEGFCSFVDETASTSEMNTEIPAENLNKKEGKDKKATPTPTEAEPEHQDDYWQYYEDCDRWGVEFAKLLSPTHLLIAPKTLNESLSTNSGIGLVGCVKTFGWVGSIPLKSRQAYEQAVSFVDLIEFHRIESNYGEASFLLEPVSPVTVGLGQLQRQLRRSSIGKLPLKSWFSQYVASPIIALDAKAQELRKSEKVSLQILIANQLESLGYQLLDFSEVIRPTQEVLN